MRIKQVVLYPACRVIALVALASCSSDDGQAVLSSNEGAREAYIDTVAIGRIPSNPDVTLFGVEDASLSDSGVLITESSTSTIRRFSLRGDEGEPIGVKGRGPGEFLSLRWTDLAGDTLVAYDGTQRRISYFLRDGSHIRDVLVPVPALYSFVQPVGRFSDGTLLIRGFTQATLNQFGTYRGQGTLFRMSRDGKKTDSLGVYQHNEIVKTATANGGYTVSSRPLGRTSFVFAWGDSIYIVDNKDRAIEKWTSGGVKRIFPDERRDSIMATAEDVRRERTHFIRGDSPDGRIAKAFDAMPAPAVLPSYGWGLDDWGAPATRTSNGALWLTLYESTRQTQPRWSVMNLAKGTTRIISANRGMRILDASDTLALVLLKDADGVETVELRRIQSK